MPKLSSGITSLWCSGTQQTPSSQVSSKCGSTEIGSNTGKDVGKRQLNAMSQKDALILQHPGQLARRQFHHKPSYGREMEA